MSEDWSYVCDEIGKSAKEGSKTFDKPQASSLLPCKELLIHCWKFIGAFWFVVMCPWRNIKVFGLFYFS